MPDAYSVFVRTQRKRLRANYDLPIVVDGEPGNGKSTLAARLGFDLDDAFSMDRMTFSTAELMALAIRLPRFSAAVLDEPYQGAFAHDWASGGNKSFAKFMGVCRERNLCLIFCMPDMEDLTGKVREGRVKWWFHAYDRGKAVVAKRVKRRHADTWWDDKFSMTWDDLSPELKAEYEARKAEVTERFGADRSLKPVEGRPVRRASETQVAIARLMLERARAWRPPEKPRQGRPMGS